MVKTLYKVPNYDATGYLPGLDFLSSSEYNVWNRTRTISNVPSGSDLATFKSNLEVLDLGRSFEVYENDGVTVATDLNTFNTEDTYITRVTVGYGDPAYVDYNIVPNWIESGSSHRSNGPWTTPWDFWVNLYSGTAEWTSEIIPSRAGFDGNLMHVKYYSATADTGKTEVRDQANLGIYPEPSGSFLLSFRYETLNTSGGSLFFLEFQDDDIPLTATTPTNFTCSFNNYDNPYGILFRIISSGEGDLWISNLLFEHTDEYHVGTERSYTIL